MARLRSVNLGTPRAVGAKGATSGIDKRPTADAVEVRAPGPKGVGASGIVGDHVHDLRHHGGNDQAVYAYAIEDLEAWGGEVGRDLPPGTFGENLTTEGIDLGGAVIGERWRIGTDVVLQVSVPRIPCNNFAAWLGEQGWIRRFTARGASGTYLRVVEPGSVKAGDAIVVEHVPTHDVTVDLAFRALTTDHDLLPSLLVAGDDLTDDLRSRAQRKQGF